MSESRDYWRLPPRIKIYEALGSIADGRVKLLSDSEAIVVSSDGTRQYYVRMRGDAINSTDNGSVYRGYLGYPAIAVLMLKGILPFDREIAEQLRGIPWRELNQRFGRYDLVEKYILSKLQNPEDVKRFVDKVYALLRRKKFRRLRNVQTTLF